MLGQILSGFETQLFAEFRRLESELDPARRPRRRVADGHPRRPTRHLPAH